MAEVADDPITRAKGLSGRASLPEFGGMLFLFDRPDSYSMWMKEMRFALDIVWMREGVVVDIEENVDAPGENVSESSLPIFAPDVAADSVLEVNAGFLQKRNIKIGDRVSFYTYGSSAAVSSAVAPSEQTVPSVALPVGSKYFIENLRKTMPQGKGLKIERVLSKTSAYQKLQISYKSGDLTISGVMYVPKGRPPQEGFPILILNHGLIHPSVYFSGRGSKREQEFFARRGYITIHPDYRGLAQSSPNPEKHHDFYVGYTQDAVSLIDALKGTNSKLFDSKRIGMWGHSMGGGIVARVMVLRPEVRAFVLFAPISADVEDNFYELSEEEVEWLHQAYGEAGSGAYRKMSPLEYFADVAAPVQLHHGTEDKDVPMGFSEKMYDTLTAYGKKAEFFKYPGEAHEFGKAWQLAAERSLQFFDKYVKPR